MFGKLDYPRTRQVDVVDDFFGTKVADPYRWLEDAEDPEVLEWTGQQHDLAAEILSGLKGRDTFARRLREVWDYPKLDIPRRRGNRLFYMRNDGLQAQPNLYVQEGDGEARVLIDTSSLSNDGTVAIIDWQPTGDGSLVMYAAAESGLDWVTFRFRDVESGVDLDDKLEKIKFSSAAWLADGSGFFYSRFPEGTADEGAGNTEISHRVYFHKLGTAQADDELVYHDPVRKGVTYLTETSTDGRFLLMFIHWQSTVANRLHYKRIDGDSDFVPLFDALDAEYKFVGNDADTFYVLTTKDAPNWRVVAVDINEPGIENWRDAVPETADTIAGVQLVNQQFVVTNIHNAHHVVKIYNKDASLAREVPLPGVGSCIAHAGAYGGADHDSMYIAFTSFLQPPQILQCDFKSGEMQTLFEATVPSFDPDLYETTQIFCRSKDGTAVPIFLTGKKGLPRDGGNPVILYAYGGYEISHPPAYRPWLPVWLENGGIFAIANIRGGGEYGKAWHRAGMFEGRQKTFDDFIAAADWLIESKYTSSNKLAIEGASNGGLLVAVCMLQRPDIYGAILCHVPTIDMFRFMHFTSGRYWTTEYGDANNNKEHFEFLNAYAPLQNIEVGRVYPPLLILTADHDDRVVPMHSKKLAAAMQAANETNNVILLRVESKAGHGMGKPTAKIIEEQVDVFVFLNRVFEMGVE